MFVFVSYLGPQSPDSACTYNCQAPIPYDQLSNVSQPSSGSSTPVLSDASGKGGAGPAPHQHQHHHQRTGHPLKSFTMPAPPNTSAPATPSSKHIGNRQLAHTDRQFSVRHFLGVFSKFRKRLVDVGYATAPQNKISDLIVWPTELKLCRVILDICAQSCSVPDFVISYQVARRL